MNGVFTEIPASWQRTSLGDVCTRSGGNIQTGPFGSQLHASDYVEVGIPTIMPENLGENRIDIAAIARIRPKDAGRLSRYLVRPGDIVYSRRGDVTKRAIVKGDHDGWLCGTGCLRIRLGGGEVLPQFCFYYLGHPVVKEWISRHAIGATLPNLNSSILSALPFVIPPRPEQETIVATLGALDDKIELNRRMNETLEAMADSIFKSWFVDFDPVRDKAEGREPVGMDAATAALFPDSFQDSPLDKIPRGWQVGTIGESFDLTMGQSPPGSTYNESGEGFPFFQGRADFGFRFPTERVYCTAPTRFANPGDTLVSVRAPVGDINMALVRCAIGRGVAAARHKTGGRSFTYYAMKSLHDEFAGFEAEGTVFGSMSKQGFCSITCVVPPVELVTRFEHFVLPLDQTVEKNVAESKTLAEIRDTLLPKLISGEIRVMDAVKHALDSPVTGD